MPDRVLTCHTGQELRHKAFTLSRSTIDKAAEDLDLLDHEFQLFTEAGSGKDSVLYRSGPSGSTPSAAGAA